MATILTKKSDTASSVPSAAQLTNSATGAELAVNTADKRLYTKDSGGNVVELGTNPSSLTLPNGTANGLAFLNASKVLTTGSALTFDGTILGNALTANATYSELLRLRNNGVGDGTGAKLSFNFSGTERGYVGATFSSGWVTDLNGTDATRFLLGGSEQMRLTSTGLGIGTSSPGSKLEVAGQIAAKYANPDVQGLLVQATTGTNAAAMKFANTGGNGYVGLDGSSGNRIGGGAYSLNIWHEAAYPIAFGTNNTLRMTLDSSGNLGLGVTPSAWATFKVMQIGNGTADTFIAVSGNQGDFGVNAYYNAGWKYQTSSVAASRYEQSSGVHQWFTAPSGTAGNAISFTQAMTLDASGNLLVGTTSATNVPTAGFALMKNGTTGSIGIGHNNSNSGDTYANFVYNGSAIGTITQNGTTAVAYNTSSDYRLKNITGPVTNSGAYIDSLKPVEGTWKADGSTFVGLIAHEVQEVSRTQVATGEKDGEQMQAMDYSSSEIIANLIAELQSLRKRVATLEAK